MTDFHDELVISTVNGDLEHLTRILAQGADPRHKNSLPIILAADRGRAECVELLIPLSDPKSRSSLALVLAATNGHAECVRLLLPVSDTLRSAPRPFHAALQNGLAEIVASMISREPSLVQLIDPLLASQNALARGHAKLAAILLSIAETAAISENISPRSEARPSIPAPRL